MEDRAIQSCPPAGDPPNDSSFPARRSSRKVSDEVERLLQSSSCSEDDVHVEEGDFLSSSEDETNG